MNGKTTSKVLTVDLPAWLIPVLIVLVLAPHQAMVASAQEPGLTPSDPACPNCQSSPQGGDDSTLDAEDLPAALGSTGYDAVVLTGQDDGDLVNLAADQLLVVSLRANDSTGYGWEVAELDPTVLQQVGEEYIQDRAESGMDGVPGWQILRFSALGAGQTPLQLAYRRPWEKAPPLETFSIQVEAAGPGPRLEPEMPAATPTPLPAGDSSPAAPSQLPSRWNWCEHGGCTPVKDQSPGNTKCGSCWAFATVGPFESAILIRDGVVRDLSEQYLVSCTEEPWDCGGGGTAHGYHYDRWIEGEAGPGARYEVDFPYSASDEPCNPPHAPHEKLCTWALVPGSPDTDAIKEAIYYAGPVKASVCSGSAFRVYSGGVFATDESALCGGAGRTNHAIVLVGWDDDQGVWYLRNSWGTDWGVYGYMKIKYGTSNVGYNASYVIYEGVPPVTWHSLSGTTGENGWYDSDVLVRLTPIDNPLFPYYGSGVKLTQYQIDSGGWQTYSVSFWISDGRHTLSFRSQDKCGNWESPKSVTLNVDTVPPSGSITLNRASPATYTAVVRASLPAHDATSGVNRMRVREAGGSWTGWQAYDPDDFWQLADPATGETYTVEVQFKDAAGHTSGIYSDAITLDINPARPASASYRLGKSTWGAGGSPASSAHYQLQNTLGQPSMTGLLFSSSYSLSSGFWSHALPARPLYPVYLPLVVRRAP